MLKNRESYLCLSAMLRAREGKLLNAERAARMIEAPSYEDAARMLTDCGYEDMSQLNAGQLEEALTAHRADIFSELDRLAPDSLIPGIFKMKYDYHNAKVLLKSEVMQLSADRILSATGRIAPAELKRLYHEEKYSEMPGQLGKAMEEAKELLARTANPQQADFALDRAFFAEMHAAAAESGNAFLQGYAKILTDAANLKGAVRTVRMGKGQEFMKDVLIPGGSVSTDRILAASDAEALASLFTHSELEEAAQLGGEALTGGTLTAFELACDNAVNAYLGRAKLVSFGSEPLTAYLAAVENEITAVRMILTGRLAGIKPGVLKERLRDMYA